MNNKTKRFLFNNIGGLLALAAVFMEAGGLREKIANITAMVHETRSEVKEIKTDVQTMATQVAVMKSENGMDRERARRQSQGR